MKISIILILLKFLLILIFAFAIILFKNKLKFKTEISFNEVSNFTKNGSHYDTNNIITNQLIIENNHSNIPKDEDINNIITNQLKIENNHSNISKDEVSNKINIISYDKDSDMTQIISNSIKIENKTKIKRVGIVSVRNDRNPGNNMVKFSIATKLKEYGFEPIIIALGSNNIDFIKNYVQLKVVDYTFKELKEKDYDILMVNSDQTWTFSQKKYFYDVAFLQFAKNWKIPKFVYGASMGTAHWFYSKFDDFMAKRLLKNFTGISLREKATCEEAVDHIGIKPEFVLDPTFLIDKKYYLDIIKDYKRDFNFSEKYIFIHRLDNSIRINEFINEAIRELNYTAFYSNKKVEDFIFGMNTSEAIITDSYHGTVFSIIFNKPFITFINARRGRGRFNSLNETFGLNGRIVDSNNMNVNYNLLLEPLNINKTVFNELRNSSLAFLRKNLGLK